MPKAMNPAISPSWLSFEKVAMLAKKYASCRNIHDKGATRNTIGKKNSKIDSVEEDKESEIRTNCWTAKIAQMIAKILKVEDPSSLSMYLCILSIAKSFL